MGMLINRHRDRHDADASSGADAPSGDGGPDKSWTNPQLIEFAKANDIDLGDAKKKADYLSSIKAHQDEAAKVAADAEAEAEAEAETANGDDENPDGDPPLEPSDS